MPPRSPAVDFREHFANGRLRVTQDLVEGPDRRAWDARGPESFDPFRRRPFPEDHAEDFFKPAAVLNAQRVRSEIWMALEFCTPDNAAECRLPRLHQLERILR